MIYKTKYNKIKRLLGLGLCLILLMGTLVSCKARPLSASDEALASVGKVGDFDVPYEELYFLAKNYDKETLSSDELWTLVSENITANYAILDLCKDAGVEYDADELEDAVDEKIKDIIDTDFGGKRKNYIEALKESSITDHYMRFTVQTDILYSALATELITSGEILSGDTQVTSYIKENFIRTWHVMIPDGDGALEKAENALDDLKNGKTTMFDLIGSTLNADLLIPGDGYAFAKGTMDERYEDAAFALKEGQYSEIVKSKGELGTGEYVDCYYIIQRLALDDEYITNNFSSLCEKYESSVVASKLEQKKSELEFVANDYARAMDIKNLPELDIGTDTYLIITLVLIGVGVVVLAIACVFIIRHFSKKKKAMLEEKKQRALRASENK